MYTVPKLLQVLQEISYETFFFIMMWAWKAACLVLFFALCGTRLCSLLSRALLSILHMVGFFSKLHVHRTVELNIEIRQLEISFWKCVWNFIRAPMEHRLFAIEITSLQLTITLADPIELRSFTSSQKNMDSLYPFLHGIKCIEHPFWKKSIPWLHRLYWICYLIHLIELKISDLSIEINWKDKKNIASLKKGTVKIHGNYDFENSELRYTMRLAQHHCSNITLHNSIVNFDLAATEIKVSLPISRKIENKRAPIPSSLLITCANLKGQSGFKKIMHELTKSMSLLYDCAPVSQLNTLGFVELLPEEISMQLTRMEIQSELENQILNTIANKISIQISDTCSADQLQKDKSEETTIEKKICVNVGTCTVRLEVQPSSSMIDHKMIEVLNSKFIRTDVEVIIQYYDTQLQFLPTCDSKIFVENRGLEIYVIKQLKPWIYLCLNEMSEQIAMDTNTCKTIQQQTLSSDASNVEFLVEFQVKLVQTGILFVSIDEKCEIFPQGTPSLHLMLEEINLLSYPYGGEESLGVRSQADIQISRLRAFYCLHDRSKTCFISLDFIRLFMNPRSLMNTNNFLPADIEIEAEWLEAKWSSQALHAFGGMVELALFLIASEQDQETDFQKLLNEQDLKWAANAKEQIPEMRTIDELNYDGSRTLLNLLQLRVTIRRSLVLFPYTFEERNYLEYITADCVILALEKKTQRFIVNITDAQVFQGHFEEDLRGNSENFTKKAKNLKDNRLRNKFRGRNGYGFGTLQHTTKRKPFLICTKFALEEIPILDCPKKVVDIFGKDIVIDWNIELQLRIMEIVRQIVFSSWEMLYKIKSAYASSRTPVETAIFNRSGGMCPSFDDFRELERYQDLLSKLISASGDTLHRLSCSNILVNTKINEAVKFKVNIGFFGGEDIPDLWTIKDVTVDYFYQQEQYNDRMISLGTLHICHTLDKQEDQVCGEWEQMRRCRLKHCGKEAPHQEEGFLIIIDGLTARVPYKFPLITYCEALPQVLSIYSSQFSNILGKYWRPQDDIFYRYFLRKPIVDDFMKIWLKLHAVKLQFADNPTEAWLERMYPVWMEELEEQELREQVLEEQVTTLKLTNADMLCEEAFQEMKTLLVEKNTKLYLRKLKKLQYKYPNIWKAPNEYQRSSTSFVQISIQDIKMDVSLETNDSKNLDLMRDMDEATQVIDDILDNIELNHSASWSPVFSLLIGSNISLSMSQLGVHMRNCRTPLFLSNEIQVNGDVLLSRRVTPTLQDSKDAFAATIKCFFQLDCQLKQPTIFFCPAYMYTLEEMYTYAQALLPLILSDLDKDNNSSVWDMIRRMLHGQVTLSIDETAVRLFRTLNSFDMADYLEVAMKQMEVNYYKQKIQMDMSGLSAKIEPGNLSNIAEFSRITLDIELEWTCADGNNPMLHYLYPLVYKKTSGEYFYVDVHASQPVLFCMNESSGNISDIRLILAKYKASGFYLHFDGKMSSERANIRRSSLFRGSSANITQIFHSDSATDKNQNSLRAKREIASRTAIILYTRQVEWLISFIKLYQKLPEYSFPRRGRNIQKIERDLGGLKDLGIHDLLRLFKGCSIKSFDVVGVDLALYHNEKHPIGFRACINDKFSWSGVFSEEKRPIEVGVVEVEASGDASTDKPSVRVQHADFAPWIVQRLEIQVDLLEVRICTSKSGSRGESLIAVKQVCFRVGDVALKKQEDVALIQSMGLNLSQLSGMNMSNKKVTMLEHFDIPQHNPFHFRDSDVPETDPEQEEKNAANARKMRMHTFFGEVHALGFLIGMAVDEVRILITLGALETIVDVTDHWYQVITTCLPELIRTPKEVVSKEPSSSTSFASDKLVTEDTTVSSKKPSCLADDPKFLAIINGNNDNSQDLSQKKPESPLLTTTTSTSTDPAPKRAITSTGKVDELQRMIMIRFLDCQIGIQDHLHKGYMVLALNRCLLNNSLSPDYRHETIDLDIQGMQMFTAPLDIDVKTRVIWMKTKPDGSYCPSSTGLLKRVIRPIPAKLFVQVERDIMILHKIDFTIPTIQIDCEMGSKDIIQNLVLSMTSIIKSKLVNKSKSAYTRMLRSQLTAHTHRVPAEGMPNGVWLPSSVANSSAHIFPSQDNVVTIEQVDSYKKQLKWKVAHLQWRQACRWNYLVSERHRVSPHSDDSVRHQAFEGFFGIATPLILRGGSRRKLSSSSLLSSISVSGMGPASLSNAESFDQLDVDSFTDELQRTLHEYESISEALWYMIRAEQKQRVQSPNVEVQFLLENSVLTLGGKNSDILRISMQLLGFTIKMYHDQSGSFALNLKDLSATNLCPGTPYPDLLLPSKKANNKCFIEDDTFIRVDAEIAPPVGGIMIVQHFEINVQPMQVCITQELVMQLIQFASVSSHQSSPKESEKEIRSQFLNGPPASYLSHDRRVGAAFKGVAKKAVKVAGKATSHFSLHKHKMGGIDHHLSVTTMLRNLDDTEYPNVENEMSPSYIVASQDGSEDEMEEKDILEMKNRAKRNILFKRIRLGTIDVTISYKNKKSGSNSTPAQALEDMRGFELKVHPLVYCDKTCSLEDLLLRIRRDIILDVMSQVGRNFTNISNFLKDQFDITRWAKFEALAPTRSVSIVPEISNKSENTGNCSSTSIQGVSEPLTPASTSSYSTAPGIDISKVFQLEMPETKKKNAKLVAPILRQAEITSPTLAFSTSNDMTTLDEQDKHQKKQRMGSLVGMFTKGNSSSKKESKEKVLTLDTFSSVVEKENCE